jgi:hypothetical protein
MALEDPGLHTVELWSRAIRMLVIARAILLHGSSEIVTSSSSADQNNLSDLIVEHTPSTGAGPNVLMTKSGQQTDSSIVAPHLERPSALRHTSASPSYAAALLPTGSGTANRDQLPISIATATPKSYPMLLTKRPVYELPSTGSGIPDGQAEIVATRMATRKASSDIQKKHMEALAKLGSDRYKDHLLPGGLPRGLWSEILAYATGAWMLNEEQKSRVLEYAMKKETIHDEISQLGKAKSFQIWKVLSAMDCLAYHISM